MRRVFSLVMALAIAGVLSASAAGKQEEAQQPTSVSSAARIGVVTADILNVRSKPSLQSEILRKVKEGASMEVLEQRGNWLQVRSDSQEPGWVHEDYLRLQEAMPKSKSVDSPSEAKGTAASGDADNELRLDKNTPPIQGLPPELSTWIRLVQRKVERSWTVPPGVKLNVPVELVEVAFMVDRSGSLVKEPFVLTDASDRRLGESGLKAIKHIGSEVGGGFPPFPDSFRDSQQGVVYQFLIRRHGKLQDTDLALQRDAPGVKRVIEAATPPTQEDMAGSADADNSPQLDEDTPPTQGLPSELTSWIRMVQRKVERFWTVPSGISLDADVVVAEVSFTVDRNGNLVKEPFVLTHASDRRLGESGLAVVKYIGSEAGGGFPPFPNGFRKSQHSVVYQFRIGR